MTSTAVAKRSPHADRIWAWSLVVAAFAFAIASALNPLFSVGVIALAVVCAMRLRTVQSAARRIVWTALIMTILTLLTLTVATVAFIGTTA